MSIYKAPELDSYFCSLSFLLFRWSVFPTYLLHALRQCKQGTRSEINSLVKVLNCPLEFYCQI